MNIEYSCVQLNDLPDEILMIIFKKLSNIAVLYSLICVNKRLNKIVCDSTFTNHLTLLKFVWSRLIVLKPLTSYFVYPFLDSILDRFCLLLLPEIHHKIKWLDLEPVSMKRILLSANYPNLYGLGLYNIQEESARYLFTDETLFTRTSKNQILSLVIDVNTGRDVTGDANVFIFTHIFTLFTNLQSLCFGSSVRLDGHFNQLHTLYVNIFRIFSSPLTINNTVEYF